MDDIKLDPTSQALLQQVNKLTEVGLYVPAGVDAPKSTATADYSIDEDIDSEVRALELRLAERELIRETEFQPTWMQADQSTSVEVVNDASENRPNKLVIKLGKVATKVVHSVFMPMVSAKEAIDRADWQTSKPETDEVKGRSFTPKKLVESVTNVIEKVKTTNRRRLAAAALAGTIVVSALAGQLINGDSDASVKAGNNSTLEAQVISPELLNQQVEKIKTSEELAPGPSVSKSIKELLPDIELSLRSFNSPEMKQKFQIQGHPEIFLNKRIIGSLIHCLSSGKSDAVSPDGQRLGLWQMTRAEVEEYFGNKVVDPFNKYQNMAAGIMDLHLRTTQVLKTGLYSPDSPSYIEDVMRAAITGKHTANNVGLDPDPKQAAVLADRFRDRYNSWGQ